MLFPPLPKNEVARMQAVHALNMLDTYAVIRFDSITKFAAEKLHVPIALVTLIDQNRQWFKSTCGVDASEVSRNISICAHAICEMTHNHPSGRIYEVLDTSKDARFFDNPMVIGEPWVRSYISFILQSEEGMNVGTLCLVDTRPRVFKEDEKALIIELGTMIEELFTIGHDGINQTIQKFN